MIGIIIEFSFQDILEIIDENKYLMELNKKYDWRKQE